MFEYSVETKLKLNQLAALSNPLCGQVVSIYWPSPVGVRHYVPMQYDHMTLYEGIVNHIDPSKIYRKISSNSNGEGYFIPLSHTGGIGDDVVSLSFSDIDHEIRNIWYSFGGDCKVVISAWLPDVDLLLPEWWGFLDSPTEITPDTFVISASLGARTQRSLFTHRLVGAPGCQAAGFGGRFSTQLEIDQCGCPYNKHIDGDIGNEGYDDCPQIELSNCTTRLGANAAKYYLGSGITQDGRAIVFAGAFLAANSQVRGNNTLSNTPYAVMLGKRFTAYQMFVLDDIADVNSDHPERAARRVLAAFSEGPIGGIVDVYIDDKYVQPQHFQLRLGEQGQPPSGFVGNVNNFSFLAHASMATFGNDPTAPPESIKIRGTFTDGYRLQRIYSDENTFTFGSTDVRIWNLFTILTNKLWGVGDAFSLYDIPSLISLAESDSENISFVDARGKTRTCKRSTFNHYFNQAQPEDEVIRQVCLWGGYTPRIQFDGKFHIGRLDKLQDLDNAPIFSDYSGEGFTRNILSVSKYNYVTSLKLESPKNPRDLTYQLNVSFYDETVNYKQVTLTIADLNYQTNQGRNIGEYRFRQNSKGVSALGITNEAEVIFRADQILACGEFYEGGLYCNLPISFDIFWKEYLVKGLHEYKVIKVYSNEIPKNNDNTQKFTYFIIRERHRLPNGRVRIVCQAYDETFFQREEVVEDPPEIVPVDPPFPYSYGLTNIVLNGDEYTAQFIQL